MFYFYRIIMNICLDSIFVIKIITTINFIIKSLLLELLCKGNRSFYHNKKNLNNLYTK